jgi:hypothetical protein
MLYFYSVVSFTKFCFYKGGISDHYATQVLTYSSYVRSAIQPSYSLSKKEFHQTYCQLKKCLVFIHVLLFLVYPNWTYTTINRMNLKLTSLITLSYLQHSVCSDTLLTEPFLLQFCKDFCCSNYVLSMGACNMHKGPFWIHNWNNQNLDTKYHIKIIYKLDAELWRNMWIESSFIILSSRKWIPL